MSAAAGQGGSRRFGPGERLLIWAAGAFGPVVLRLLGATWSISVRNRDAVDAVHASGRPAVFAFWHCHILPIEYAHRGSGVCVLSSWHRDGEISARLMRALGYVVERGSTTRGSVRGLLKMVARAKKGCDLAVTPDGPKGPARTAQAGTLFLAVKAGGPVVPVAVGVNRYRRLSSWDGFFVPLPFARIVIEYGGPIEVADGDDLEAGAAALTEELERLVEFAQLEVEGRGRRRDGAGRGEGSDRD